MPTYEYECNSCQHRFELFQSITANAKRKCPECGRMTLRRLIGPGAAIVFKGSGFYQTDYRSESYKKAASAEKKSDSNGKSGDDKAAKTTSSDKTTSSHKTKSPDKAKSPEKTKASAGAGES